MQRVYQKILRNPNSLLKCVSCIALNDLKRFSSASINSSLRTHKRLVALKFNNPSNSYIQKCFYTSNLPEHSLIRLPALSPTMEHGTLARWAKKEGDQITEGDLIAEIETDKATMGLESSEEGYIAKILVPEKSKDVPLKTLLCIIVRDKKDLDAFKDFKETTAPSPVPAVPSATPVPEPTVKADAESAAATTQLPQATQINASHLVKRLAAKRGIELSLVKGSGPNGLIKASDVFSFAGQASEAPASPTTRAPPAPAPIQDIEGVEFVDIPVSSVRAVIAKRLLQSKQTIPHYYLSIDVDLEQALKVRQELNNVMSKEKVKISVTDIVIKAAALACRKVPEVNSAWMNTFIRQYAYVDVSVAVATDNGLITPIVFDADEKGLATINADLINLAQKARAGKLQPNEFQGGTLTISNLGMYGIGNFAAVINPPQACILAVGGAQKKLVPTESGEIRTGTFMSVTLSCDHRVVDGAVGAKWLEYFKKHMENPMSMLI